MILIFTTIKRTLYKRDILNVCCEPPKSQIQFAYQLKWIAEPLRKSPQHLKEKEALIVYCAETGQPYVYKFYPVRKATIACVNEESGFITLGLRMGEFFDYSTFGDGIDDVMNRFQEFVTDKKTDHPNNTSKSAANEPKARFLCEGAWGEARYTAAWTSLVSYLYNVEGLHDSVFFSVQSKTDFGGEPVPLFPDPVNTDYPTSFSLQSGGNYTVSVFLMAGRRAEYKDPELTIKDNVASISGPFVRQRSSGYQADFDVQCKRSFDESRSMMTLRVPAKTAGAFDSPVADVLIKLSPRRGLLALVVTLVTVGGFFIALTPEVLSQLPLVKLIQPNDWLSFGLKIVGVLMLGTGSYVGFRKLPGAGGE